jgi:hypothetical protein
MQWKLYYAANGYLIEKPAVVGLYRDLELIVHKLYNMVFFTRYHRLIIIFQLTDVFHHLMDHPSLS